MPRGNQLARQRLLLQLIDRPAGIVDDAARTADCTIRYNDNGGADGRHVLSKLQEHFTLGLPVKPVKLSLAETATLIMGPAPLPAV
jgi:hypothetical protein